MPPSTPEMHDMALNARTVVERNRLFRGLPAATIDRIAALAIRRDYARGESIFAQSDPADGLYGVVTGRVRISASSADGKELFLNIMEPGDTFGEIALLDGRWADFIPGWDMHGLPIERETLIHLGVDFHKIDPIELRAQCKERALYWLDRQRTEEGRNFRIQRQSAR